MQHPVRGDTDGDAEEMVRHGLSGGCRGVGQHPVICDTEGHAQQVTRCEDVYMSAGWHSTRRHSPVSTDLTCDVPIYNEEIFWISLEQRVVWSAGIPLLAERG